MSILLCDQCGRMIDTDDCPEAYFEEEGAWYCYFCAPDPDYDDLPYGGPLYRKEIID